MSKLSEALHWKTEEKSNQEITELFEEAKKNGDCKQFARNEHIQRLKTAQDHLNFYIHPKNCEQKN